MIDIGNEPITVADVQIIKDADAGDTLILSCWAMKQPHVLQFTISMPYQEDVISQYDLQDCGAAVTAGFKKLGDHLNKKLGDDQ
jgi:hypothetical protein